MDENRSPLVRRLAQMLFSWLPDPIFSRSDIIRRVGSRVFLLAASKQMPFSP